MAVGNTREADVRPTLVSYCAYCTSPRRRQLVTTVMVNVVIREVRASPAYSIYILIGTFTPKVVSNVWTFSTYVSTLLTDYRIVMTLGLP